jgi:hypothetical protein
MRYARYACGRTMECLRTTHSNGERGRTASVSPRDRRGTGRMVGSPATRRRTSALGLREKTNHWTRTGVPLWRTANARSSADPVIQTFESTPQRSWQRHGVRLLRRPEPMTFRPTSCGPVADVTTSHDLCGTTASQQVRMLRAPLPVPQPHPWGAGCGSPAASNGARPPHSPPIGTSAWSS